MGNYEDLLTKLSKTGKRKINDDEILAMFNKLNTKELANVSSLGYVFNYVNGKITEVNRFD